MLLSRISPGKPAGCGRHQRLSFHKLRSTSFPMQLRGINTFASLSQSRLGLPLPLAGAVKSQYLERRVLSSGHCCERTRLAMLCSPAPSLALLLPLLLWPRPLPAPCCVTPHYTLSLREPSGSTHSLDARPLTWVRPRRLQVQR